MPKAAKKKYYAVRRGREGPKIYEDWDETKLNVARFPGAVHKSFTVRSEAEAWLALGGPYVPPPLPADYEAQRTSGRGNDRQPKPDPVQPIPLTVAVLPAPAPEPAVKLSPEQQQVFNRVKTGQNVFFTGSAGTGKSVLLREIIKWLRETSKNYAVTASTGIASVNIGGCTLHSWAGVGLGQERAKDLVGKILGQSKYEKQKAKERRMELGLPSDDEFSVDDIQKGNKTKALERWHKCQCLIIDEISMVDGLFFDKLEYIARRLRNNNQPFGGIQLVISGDFLQLPPVMDKRTVKDALKDTGIDQPLPVVFAFQADSWNKCVGRPIALKKVFRQKDAGFVEMLNEMRVGSLSPSTVRAFMGLCRRVEYTDGIEPTELYCTRAEVSGANARRLNVIRSPSHMYHAQDRAGWNSNGNRIDRDRMNTLLDRLVAQKDITLKVDAQVMLIKNLVQGSLVNGTIGKVVDFMTTMDAAKRGVRIGLTEGSPKPQPLKHPKGPQRSVEGNSVPEEILHSPILWPLVKFSPSGAEVLCVPNVFEVTNAEGVMEARREQVPLILAWALSIHKSQGQTLERVRVDLRKAFEKGQAYVALSRATSMATLELVNFDPGRVEAHRDVLAWMRANTNMHVPSSDADEPGLQYWSQDM